MSAPRVPAAQQDLPGLWVLLVPPDLLVLHLPFPAPLAPLGLQDLLGLQGQPAVKASKGQLDLLAQPVQRDPPDLPEIKVFRAFKDRLALRDRLVPRVMSALSDPPALQVHRVMLVQLAQPARQALKVCRA